MNVLKEKVNAQQQIVGTHVSMSDPSICELLGYMGFDYIWIDMEHTYIDCERLYTHLRAARSVGASVIVRVPQDDYVILKRVMEMGVDGIVFPMIRDSQTARKAIDWTFYPPRGIRGFGPRSPIHYGLESVTDYIRKGSLDMCRFIQIEHMDAVSCLDELMQIDGIDGFVIGPCDFAGSMGHLDNPNHPDVLAQLTAVIRTLRENGKYVAISTGAFDRETIERYRAMGIQMISAGADTDYILYGAKAARQALAL